MNRPRARFQALAAGGLILLGVAGVTLVRMASRDDLTFNGRRLSASVFDLLEPQSQTYATSSNSIAQLGVRTLPYLQRLLSHGESSFEKAALRFKLPLPAHRLKHGRQLAVCRAAAILGTNAVPLASDLLPLTQSPIGSIRQAAFQALAFTSTPQDLLPLLTNAIARDPFPDCRLTAVRIAHSFGMDPAQVLDCAIGNIGKGSRLTASSVRAFGTQLQAMVPEQVLEHALDKFSRSDIVEVRRFVAICAPLCLKSNALVILEALAKDTNAAVSGPATTGLAELTFR